MTRPDLSPARALWRAAEQHPSRLSLVDAGTGQTWSVAQSWLDVRRTVTALSDLGVGVGQTVAIVSANSPWHFIVHLACSWLGAITMPLSERLPEVQLTALLQERRPALVLRDLPGFADLVRASAPASGTPPARHDEVAAILHTSGSTGRPSPVRLTHANLWWASASFRDGFEYSPGTSVVGVCAPMSHIGGFNGTSMDVVSHGGCVVTFPAFDPAAVLQAVASWRITMMFAVPAMCHALIDAQERIGADLSSWDKPLIGGDRMSPALEARLRGIGLAPIHVWGMTQTGGAGAMCSPEAFAAHPGAIGRPFPHVDLRIVDEGGAEVGGPGVVGRLQARGPGVVAAPGAWLDTGDLAFWDDDAFVHFVSRTARVINTGGELVAPWVVEEALESLPQVAEAFVVPVEDERWGQVVAAVLVATPAASSAGSLPEASELRERLADRLAPWQQVRRVLWVESVPITSTGKPDIFAAQALFA